MSWAVFLLLPNYHMLLLLLPACTCGQKKRARVGACADEGQTRRLADAKGFKEHEEEAKTADKPVPTSPINRTHLKSDDVIAVLSKTKDRLARIVEVFSEKVQVRWFVHQHT